MIPKSSVLPLQLDSDPVVQVGANFFLHPGSPAAAPLTNRQTVYLPFSGMCIFKILRFPSLISVQMEQGI